MQTFARTVKTRLTPTLRHLLSSSSAGPSCGLHTLSHAHGGFTPNAAPSATFPSFSPLDGHRRQLHYPFSQHSSQLQLARFLCQQAQTSKPQSSSNEHVEAAAAAEGEVTTTTHGGGGGGGGVTLKGEEEEVGSKEYLQLTQRRWEFIRKVYGIVGAQLLTTAAVSSAAALIPGFGHFLVDSPNLLLGLFFGSLVTLWPLHTYKNDYPKNMITLGAFTLMQSLLIGSVCAVIDGKVVLEALATTTAVVSSLTAYTFWAVRRGKDLSLLGPILFPCLTAMVTISLINIFLYPVPALDSIAYNTFGALVFSGYLVLDTYCMIEDYKDNEYISASINLYLDILNLFLRIMKILNKMKRD